jgi:hypothetical protein
MNQTQHNKIKSLHYGSSLKPDITKTLPVELWDHIFTLLFKSLDTDEKSKQTQAFLCANGVNRYVRYATRIVRRTMMIGMGVTMDNASRKGQLDLLDWWLNGSGFSRETLFDSHYTSKAIGFAAENNLVNILTWWRKSSLPLKYDNYALEKATENGNKEVLHWWKENNLEFHYVKSPLDIARERGHWEVVEWWIRISGQPLVFRSSPSMFVRRNLFTEVVGY